MFREIRTIYIEALFSQSQASQQTPWVPLQTSSIFHSYKTPHPSANPHPAKIIQVSSCQRVPSHDAYTVDIAGRSFPLRVPVAAVPNSFKRLLDVGIDTGGLGKVKLVPVAVRILAASVAGLRPTSDSEATLACFLQCNSALDGGFSDPFVGSAMRIVLVSAAAAGPRLNPGSFEARRSLRLGKSLGANYGGHDNSNDSKELGTVSRGRALWSEGTNQPSF